MNSDQKMVATIGLILILLVIFGVYRKTLTSILFNAPAGNTNYGPNLPSLLNPLNLVNDPSTTNGASTNANPAPQPSVTVGGPEYVPVAPTNPYGGLSNLAPSGTIT